MYRIFSSLPIVWVGETTVQIGSEDPVFLEGLTVADVELINNLRLGVSAHDFDSRAQRCGVPPQRAVELLALLHDAGALGPPNRDIDSTSCHDAFAASSGLDPSHVSEQLAATAVAVSGPLATLTTGALGAAGLHARTLDIAELPEPGEAVVLTAVLAPDLLAAGQMFDAGIRHMHLVAGESSATVGHLISPGITPCSGCQVAEASRADDTWLDAWRALRGAGWNPERLDAGLLALAAARAALELRSELTGLKTDPVGIRLRLPDGSVEAVPATFSPECTCRIPLSDALVG